VKTENVGVNTQHSERRAPNVEPPTPKAKPRPTAVAPRTPNLPRARRGRLVERAVLLPVALTLMTALLPLGWISRRRHR